MSDELVDRPSLRAGQVADGRYRIERIIGHGAMGVIYEATHLNLGRRVAIKVLLEGTNREDVSAQRLLREARAGMGLQSEHVAHVLDVGFLPSGEPFIVMELLEGADLRAVIDARGALPVDEAVDYVLQACEALVEAHARGIVHRDLKLGNLFLTKRVDGSPLVKVLDFGVSKVSADPAGRDMSLTESRAMLGSPHYMSPEQIRSSRNVDNRTDVWALGVILYKMIRRRHPLAARPCAGCAILAGIDQKTLWVDSDDAADAPSTSGDAGFCETFGDAANVVFCQDFDLQHAGSLQTPWLGVGQSGLAIVEDNNVQSPPNAAEVTFAADAAAARCMFNIPPTATRVVLSARVWYDEGVGKKSSVAVSMNGCSLSFFPLLELAALSCPGLGQSMPTSGHDTNSWYTLVLTLAQVDGGAQFSVEIDDSGASTGFSPFEGGFPGVQDSVTIGNANTQQDAGIELFDNILVRAF